MRDDDWEAVRKAYRDIGVCLVILFVIAVMAAILVSR